MFIHIKSKKHLNNMELKNITENSAKIAIYEYPKFTIVNGRGN